MPVNLREHFGDVYRVSIDKEAANGPRDRDPWLCQIRCRRGLIYPYSDTHLAVQVDGHREIARRMAQTWKLIQDGDREKTFLVPVEDFAAVVKFVMPYRRPVLTAEQRAERGERARRLNKSGAKR